MQYIDHYLTIDMLRERVPDTIWIRAAGIGNRLHVKLSAGPETVELPGETEGLVQFVYQKPGGEKSDVAMTVNEFRASVVIPRAAVDTVGVVTCEIRVYDSTAGTWWTSPQFTITVQDAVYDENAQQQIVSDPTVYESILGTEATRVANEEAREAAEETRAENETRRQQAMADMQGELDDMSDELDDMQSALDAKADKNHTVITGSLSMNRAAGSTVGNKSVALGSNCIASGNCSIAVGSEASATSYGAVAMGVGSEATGYGSVAEGGRSQSSGMFSHAEGNACHATASASHAEGYWCDANKTASHAEGLWCVAESAHQHVQGKYNIEDTEDKYAHIQGNGTGNNSRSNAHTVDWEGNAWFAGDVRVGGTDYDDAEKLVTESEMDAAIAEALVDPASFVIEDALSNTSENAVQNKVIKAALDAKADAAAVQVKVGTFTPAFEPQLGSYVVVKQIGKIVYIYGLLGTDDDWGTAVPGILGNITGVDGPATVATIPVMSGDGTDMHAGYISTALGVVGANVNATDDIIMINGYYFTE